MPLSKKIVSMKLSKKHQYQTELRFRTFLEKVNYMLNKSKPNSNWRQTLRSSIKVNLSAPPI